jgi:uncharacterized protein
MRIKVKEIGDEGLALKLPVTATWLAAECPDLDARPGRAGLGLSGRLQRMGNDYLLRGNVKGALEMSCARCLEQAEVPLDIPVAVTFVEKEAGDADGDADEDDVEVSYVDVDAIDVGAELRDQILLALPVSPLCAETCLGLCPLCGGNRNQVPCDCQTRQRHQGEGSALAALAKLKV